MSDTPPHANGNGTSGRDRTPELTGKRDRSEKDGEDRDRDRSRHRSKPDDDDEEQQYNERRRHRHRHRDREDRDRDADQDDERRERRRRHHHEDETEEGREERRRRRRERDAARDGERDGGRSERGDRGDRRERRRDDDRELIDRPERDGRGRDRIPRDSSREYRPRDRSRESHRSHRSRDVDRDRPNALREMTREEKEAEREKRDREMQEERREAARAREERFADMDRERERERRMRGPPPDRPPYSPRNRPYSPGRARGSPTYDAPPPPRSPPRSPPPPKDPVNQLLDEVDSEARSVFVSQLAARLTSSDLGLFFEDKLGRGAVRDARVVTDRVSRRSKGIGYVELDAVELVNRALSMSGTLVMGIPISIQLTEAERNRQGQVAAALAAGVTATSLAASSHRERPERTYQQSFPPLSTGLRIPRDVDVDAHKEASIPYHRLFVSNLSMSLSTDDLRQVFEAFGEIEFVDLHYSFSGESKGTAYVQFRDLRSAQMALDAMNGFDLAGRKIRVQTIQERTYVAEQIEDSGHPTRLDNTQRQQLMQKLARTEPNGGSASSAPRSSAPAPARSAPTNPTVYLSVSNMFNPEEETERNWDLDLAEDVKGEVESNYGKLRRVKVDKMSAGDVYLEFEQLQDARAAAKGLDGRFFGGRSLGASFISETLFKAHV